MTTRTHALFDPANLGPDLSVTQGGEVLQIDDAGLSTARTGRGTVPVLSGSWFAEFVVWGEFDALAGAVGIVTADASLSVQVGEDAEGYGYDLDAGLIRYNGATVATVDLVDKGDVIGVFIELDAQQVTFYRNGVAQHTEPFASAVTDTSWHIAASLGSGSEADLRAFVNTGRRAFEFPVADADGWYSIPPTISTVRLSIGDYISAPGDVPANTAWDPCIAEGNLTIVSQLDFWPWGGGRGRGSAAQLVINDADGVYDELIGTNVRDLEVLIDTVDQNAALTTAQRIGRFVVERVDVVDDGLKRLVLRDASAQLDLPVQRRLFLPSLPEDVANRPVPIRLGVCRSVEPILISDGLAIATSDPRPTYQVADAAIAGFGALRDKGDILTLGVDWSLLQGQQQIQLNENPVGKLTLDLSSVGGAGITNLAPQVLADWDVVQDTTEDSDGRLVFEAAAIIGGPQDMSAWVQEAGVLTAGRTYSFVLQLDFMRQSVDLSGVRTRFSIGQGVSGVTLLAPVFSATSAGTYAGTFVATSTGPVTIGYRSNSIVTTGDGAIVSRFDLFEQQDTTQADLLPITLADFVAEIMARAGIPQSRWSLADAQALDLATGYGLGYSATEPVSVRQALQDALQGYCASVYEDRDGVLRFARLEDPATLTSVGEITDPLADLAVTLDTAPGLTAQIAGRRNWTVLDPTDFVTDFVDVPIATRKLLSRRFQSVRTTGVQLPSEYAHARGAADPLPTLIDEPDSLQAEIDRVCALYAVPRFFYEARVPIDDLALYQLGQCWTLMYPRYGLDAGKRVILVGITEDQINETATLRLWG